MRKGVRDLARRVAHTAGVFGLARRFTRQHPRILVYHNVAPRGESGDGLVSVDALRLQLEHIRRHYRPVPLSALAAAIASPAAVPERSVAITFDDGHASFLRLAMPVFETLNIPVTMFVVSDLLEPGSWLWTDKLQSIATAMPTGSQWSNDRSRLRELTALEPRERNQCLLALAATAGVDLPEIPPQRYQLLSWNELEQLAANPLVEIGSHTRSHRLLAALDADTAWDEIRGSKERLEARLGIEVRSFAYPFGVAGDYLASDVALVRKAGYRCAVTCSSGNENPMNDRFTLPRVGVDSRDQTFFAKHLDGFELLQRRFMRRFE